MLALRALTSLLVLACLSMVPPTCHAADRCLDTADEILFKVRSWSGLRKWFESYADRDDGYLAEGVSDYVVASLAHHWNDLPALKRQIKKNPRFEAFVLRHVDATADSSDLEAVIENATKHCPDRSSTLCTSLISAAREALEEVREVRREDARVPGDNPQRARRTLISTIRPTENTRRAASASR
jgi:hypothetical protein